MGHFWFTSCAKCSWLFHDGHGDHSNAVTGSRCRWSGSANSNLKTCLVTADPTMKSHNSSESSWLLAARLLLPDAKSKIQGLFHAPAKQLQQTQAICSPIEPMSPLMHHSLSGRINNIPKSSTCWISISMRTVLVKTLEPWKL